jgi:hypothetical protein
VKEVEKERKEMEHAFEYKMWGGNAAAHSALSPLDRQLLSRCAEMRNMFQGLITRIDICEHALCDAEFQFDEFDSSFNALKTELDSALELWTVIHSDLAKRQATSSAHSNEAQEALTAVNGIHSLIH